MKGAEAPLLSDVADALLGSPLFEVPLHFPSPSLLSPLPSRTSYNKSYTSHKSYTRHCYIQSLVYWRCGGSSWVFVAL